MKSGGVRTTQISPLKKKQLTRKRRRLRKPFLVKRRVTVIVTCLKLDDHLMATMKNGQPWRRYEDDLKRKREEEITEHRIMEPAKKADEEKAKQDLKIELQRHRKKLKEDAREKSKLV